MPTNDILPFATAGGALVQTQAQYLADVERLNGNQPGVARPEFVNKTLKQTAIIAAGIGQFLADNQTANINDALTPAALATIIVNAIKQLTQTPAGIIVWIPGTIALPNTLKVNGPLLSRATYPRLYAYAQTSNNMAASDAAWVNATGMFSPGDGSTTFRIPDLRGFSIRAWDDGRGVNTGRVIGSIELDQNQQHAHGVSDPSHAHGASVGDPGHAHTINNGATLGRGDEPYNAGQGGDLTFNFPVATAAAGTGISVGIAAAFTNISIQNQGGSEVRTKTIALMPVIYY